MKEIKRIVGVFDGATSKDGVATIRLGGVKAVVDTGRIAVDVFVGAALVATLTDRYVDIMGDVSSIKTVGVGRYAMEYGNYKVVVAIRKGYAAVFVGIGDQVEVTWSS